MKKVRVGVVGPKDSVTQVLKAGEHFKELDLIPFIYERTEETEDIIVRNHDWVDQWFFSGQAPYYYALSKGVLTEDEGSYVPLHGSSLLSTLLEMFVKEGKIVHRVSLDTIQEDEIEKAKNAFSLHELTFYTISYSGYMPAEDIIQFHKNLYENNQIDVAITCISSVYHALKKLRIPVYRVIQSELAVQRSLGFIKERGQTSWYRKSQLVMIGIEIIYPSQASMGHPFSFKLKHQELELKRVLLDFVEEISGSIVQVGDGLHYIYTTRGELERFTKQRSIYSIVDEIFVNSKLPVRIGIGYGLTVLEAEEHVRMAIEQVRKQEDSGVVIINEDKKVIELLEDEQHISYIQRKQGSEWEKLFKDAGISSSLAAKIESLSHHYGQTAITSHDLARWLKSTERNARRILAEMERIGLAKVTGEESVGRGRPRKIYQLIF
ncbi:MAG: hypothetical protein H0Z31_01305 [Bacillus sp. (in: Bacteria)]|jgi:hypothetical protein|nr:hypothetical protein [Bacillus sp. (in: firmicutes)]